MDTFEVFWGCVALIVLFIVSGGTAGISVGIGRIAHHSTTIVNIVKGFMPHKKPS